MDYGYIRVGKSTDPKVEEGYITKLKEFGVKSENIYKDVGSYWEDLPVFKKLINNILKSKDILYVPQLKQIGKSLIDFLQLQQELRYKDVLLIVLELPQAMDLNFQYQLQDVLCKLGQKEAEQRIRRQKRGIEEAKEKGLFPPKTRMTEEEVYLIYKLKKEKKTVAEIATLVPYSRATIYRVLSQQYRYPRPSEK